MPTTTIITGRDITFTIAADTYDAQATSAMLEVATDIGIYNTLAGKSLLHLGHSRHI
jgi:hypothetical protein